METVLRGLSPKACLIYLDDIIIVGRDFEEQLNNLRKVLEKLKQANLQLNPAKCNFFPLEVSYLGHIISAEGVRTDPRKVAAVKEWSKPRNVHELRSFLGLCTYYRRFIKGFSLIVRPFHRWTEHKRPFVWSEECEVAFTSLKEALTSTPILSYLDPDKQFILDTDASHANVGAVLPQEIDGQERVIAYWTEMKYEKTVPVVRQITASATSHLDPWSDEEVREAQMKDPDLKPIIERMESSSCFEVGQVKSVVFPSLLEVMMRILGDGMLSYSPKHLVKDQNYKDIQKYHHLTFYSMRLINT
ncbi:retrovirus-related Pol polyprotein from transposon opus [Nephila pilipes]|uniref:RNA-directed DNA polymerase n=1 Tax=Nephila pilipes TaxID=299642 RepID=A0A8X6NL35_NEPPI|nr:retrovirus-related Pol polyprotein from transposon opus [Nephila pilipes]